MEIKVPLTDVTLGEEEAQAAAAVVRSGWVTMGAQVAAFEREFSAYLGAAHGVAVTNGTAGLHIAYQAAGLGPGDEFLMPGLTFVATMNAGLYLGARPVLVDIAGEDDLTLSVDDLESKITPRTRLIVTMPYGGFCPDMERICALAAARGIPVIEDACHAPGATLAGRAMGTWGLIGSFSFFGNKNLAIGEGGMLVTADEALAAELRRLRTHGMSTTTWDRHRGGASAYDVVSPGYNYRMDEVRAAIGREQLKKLPAMTEARRAAAARMRAAIEALGIETFAGDGPDSESLESGAPKSGSSAIEGLRLPFGSPRGEPVHHVCPALLPAGVDRARFREALAADGVQTSVHYPPLTGFTQARAIWGGHPPRLPRLDSIADRLVTLPMGPTLTTDQIEIVAASVRRALASA